MTDSTQPGGEVAPRPAWAVAIIGLWLPYAALNLFFPGPLLGYGFGSLIALVSVGAVFAGGARATFTSLRPRRLSRRGALYLIATLVYLPIAFAAGRFADWNWSDMVLSAGVSALAQEVYFRVTLPAALSSRLPARSAWLVQVALFAAWHARAFRVVSPGLAMVVVGGSALAGLFWGTQVHRDRTVVYAAAAHWLILAFQ